MEPRINPGIKARLAHLSAYPAPLRNGEWVVYSPFGGPEEVLRYLARYTIGSPARPPPRSTCSWPTGLRRASRRDVDAERLSNDIDRDDDRATPRRSAAR
jgi:hypothetical protein